MTDHNLDDLIIDNIEPKNRKTKSFLTIIALSIVVLIVGIILTRTILKTPGSDKLVLHNDPVEYIAPELKLQEKPKPAKPVQEPKLEKVIEKQPKPAQVKTPAPVVTPKPKVIEKPKVVQKPKVDNTLKNIDNNSYEVPKPRSIGTVNPEKTTQKPVVSKPVIKEPEMPKPVEKKPTVQPPVVKKPAVKESIKKAPIKKEPIVKTPVPIISEPVIKKPVAKPPVKPTQKYYIQVGSFSKDPSPRFLSVIKKNGFKYHLTKPNSRGTKKLHIGPYNTRAEVNTALKRVKDLINKSAFVVKK